jgi:TonB-dependent receptor
MGRLLMTSKLEFSPLKSRVAKLMAATSLMVLATAFAAPAHAQQQATGLPATAPQTPGGDGVPQSEPQTADNEATEAAGEEIVVTGFRSSLRASLNEKRNASGVVDVIKAEDIADFPDNNLAESIQRIPGVTIARDQGEGRQITVRGLGPLFTRVRVNGIEGLSTTGGADASGGANRSRQFDFNVFASELFNSITVRKTASADVEEGSLGATVDLVSARPFDYRGNLTIAGSAQVGYNDLSNAYNPRVAGLVSARFLDGRLGVLVSGAYSEREILEEGSSTVRWERGTDNGGFAAASALPTGAGQGFAFFHPRIPRYDSFRYNTQRLGLTGSLQFQATDSTLLTFDALYANFKSQRSEQYLEAISFSRSGTGKPQTVILPGAVVDANNSLVFGTFNNVDVRVESRFDELETDFQQYTLSLSQDFGDRLKLNLLGGISKSDFSNPIQTTVALDAANVQGYSYDFRTDSRFPVFNYGNLDVANAGSFTLGEIRLRPQFVENRFKVARGELAYEASDALTFKGGVDYKKYSFGSRELRRASETVVPTLAAGQLATLTSLYSFSGSTPLPAGTPRTFVVPNLDAFSSNLGIYSNSTARSNFRTVDEEDLGVYGQADFDLTLGGIGVRGNAGVRWVKTKQRSTGYTGNGATLTLVEVERKYDHWLPSLNVAADIASDFVLRGSVAKVLTRPDIGTVNPGGAFSISGGNRTFSRGNPLINPTEATTYDVSAEWYFAPESAFIVGLFYKDIGSFVANTSQQIPFNQLNLPESLLTGTTVQPTDLFTVTQPVNSKGGSLKGAEIAFQMPFRFLPGPFNNLGIQANYTYVKSEIEYPLTSAANAPVVKRSLTGLSEHSANATLYYEDETFSIRGSVSYRSDYLTQVPGRNGVSPPSPNAAQPTFNDVEGTHGAINLDMAASYTLTKNITLTLEAVNLLGTYTDQYIDSQADRLSVYHHTGRQFYAGVRFKF